MRPLRVLVLAAALAAASCSADPQPATTTAAPATSPAPTTTVTTAAPVTTSNPPAARTFVGADGVESAITDTSRIVTLAGDLTETAWLLGFGDSVVARDVTTIFPAEAAQLPVVGVGRFLTAEGVLAHDPTLVIGDTQVSPPEAIAQIRSAGVPVVILPVPTTFEGLYEKIEDFGELLGVPRRGTEIAAALRADIDAAVAGGARYDPPPGIAFVYSRGPDVMLLFGREMTPQPLIEAAGGVDVGVVSGVVGTVSVTPEAMVAAAPDVIIITSEGLEALGGIDGLLAIPGFAETPAGRERRILDYPEGDFLTFGPRIGESLELLIADLGAVLGVS